ncbi:MAG: T9SS type A sorting domain-containing protein, partial [Bacteroidales bacterium]
GQTSNGCDSNITVTLTVNPNYFQPLDVTVCESELPYYYHNIAYTEAGNYNIPFETTAGCDSIVLLNLVVNPTYNLNTTITICESQLPYIMGQDTLTYTGQYVINRSSANGCDSIINLYLIVNSNLEFTQTQSICESALPYQFGDSIFTEAGIYEVVFQANNGCDSIITLTLQVLDTYFTEENISIMDNEVYVWHNMTLNTNGTYLDTVISSIGCDSICRLNLTVLKTYFFEETTSICEGEAYTWHGKILERNGLYFDSLTTVLGGDSIYQLTLTVHPTSLDIQHVALCSNQLPYQWHGVNLTENGTYQDTLQSIAGCDSIFVLNLTIHIHLYDTTCQGENYQLNGFNIACDTAGNYVREMTFTNQYQCDSIVTLHLTVHETVHTVVAETACIAYTWNNQTYYTSGTYRAEFPMQNGCDSVVVLNLTIQLPARDTVYQTACSSYTWNGTTYSESGTYSKLFTGRICDSTAVLILTVNQPDLIRLYDTLCLGERYQNYGFDTIPATAGNIICQTTYTNTANCDSTVILTLTVHSTYLMEDVVTICDNDAPYAWHNQTFTTSGIYYDSLVSVNGCDSIYQLVLTIHPAYNIELSDSVIVGEHYLNNGLDFTPSQTGSFNFTIENVSSANCDSIIHLTLIVYESSSIDSYGIEQFITIFPNPAKNFFTVSSNQSVLTQIDIFDVSGRNVQTQYNINDYTKELSVENYAPGIYFVKIYTKDGISTKKLIVQ